MFYIQYSYEQVALINKLNRQIKAFNGTDIKLSDDDVIDKIHVAMHDIRDDDIVHTYQYLQQKLKPEQTNKTTTTEPRIETKPAKTKKTIIYRGNVIEVDESISKKDMKANKKHKITYRGHKL